MQYEFVFEGERYHVARRSGQWTVRGGDVAATGPTMADAIEAAIGALDNAGWTHIAAELQEQADRDQADPGPPDPALGMS
jgi:hypothetical protein